MPKGARLAEMKTKPTSASVDAFVAAIENPRRRSEALIAMDMEVLHEIVARRILDVVSAGRRISIDTGCMPSRI